MQSYCSWQPWHRVLSPLHTPHLAREHILVRASKRTDSTKRHRVLSPLHTPHIVRGHIVVTERENMTHTTPVILKAEVRDA